MYVSDALNLANFWNFETCLFNQDENPMFQGFRGFKVSEFQSFNVRQRCLETLQLLEL